MSDIKNIINFIIWIVMFIISSIKNNLNIYLLYDWSHMNEIDPSPFFYAKIYDRLNIFIF